jgi:predicted molibdopterin-dependent oxidoreductase YjgC
LVPVDLDLPPCDPEYPLTLMPGRLLYDRGTLLRRSGRIQNLVPEAFVVVHPTDAEELGLVDGDDVSVVTAREQLTMKARISQEIVPGTVFAPLNLSDAPLSVLVEDRGVLARVRLVK